MIMNADGSHIRHVTNRTIGCKGCRDVNRRPGRRRPGHLATAPTPNHR
jgi:hypothetical protein